MRFDVEHGILRDLSIRLDPAPLSMRIEMTEDKIRKIVKITKELISIEVPIDDGGDSHLGDFIEGNRTLASSDAALHASTRGVLKDS